MKKISLVVISIIFAASGALAGSAKQDSLFDRNEELDIPVQLEEIQGGFPESPVVPCPRPSKKYADLLNQLSAIKTQIKSEACKDSNIEVKSLEQLVGEDRKKFLELIKQGTFGEGQLDANQVKQVETYVQNIVEKAATITGLVNNAACFEDGKGDSVLGFVSSVISEVSGAVGALAGPFGAKLSLGGKIAGALIGSVDKIVTARKTYTYTYYDKTLKRRAYNMEDINNYFNNLCTYHDFKGDLDIESDLIDPRDRYNGVYAVAEEYLENIGEVCPACDDVITQFDRLQRKGEVDIVNPRRAEPGEERGTDNEDEKDLFAPRDGAPPFTSGDGPEQVRAFFKRAEDMTPEEWVSVLKVVSAEAIEAQRVAEEKAAITFESGEVFEEPVMAPIIVEEEGAGMEWEQYGLPYSLTDGPTTYIPMLNDIEATVRALLVRSWVRNEVEELEKTIREGNGKPGRGGVTDEQEKIEKFLINKEAISFVKHMVDKFGNSFDNLKGQARLSYGNISNTRRGFQRLQPDPNFDPYYKEEHDYDTWFIADTFNELYRKDIDFAHIIEEALGLLEYIEDEDEFERLQDRATYIIDKREEDKEAMRTALSRTIDDYLVVRDRCMFFKRSYFSKNSRLKNTCIRAGRKLDELVDIIGAIKETSFAPRAAFILTLVVDEHAEHSRPNYVRDWLSSVSYAVGRDLKQLNKRLED